jgi:very-short-patch-repair endonuclease
LGVGLLQGLGFTMMRFWNHEVLKDVATVIDQIRLALPLAIDLARTDQNPYP